MDIYKSAVFISYAWGDEREEIVNQIDGSLQERGLKIIRDKRDLPYKGSIKEFMERIGKGDCVIVVISDKYLRSPNCMFELVEIAENKDFRNRIFPIIWKDANIYDPLKRIEYIKHWEVTRANLARAMKKLDPANLQGIREEMDLYDRIRDKISGLTSILKDMNTLTPEMHQESNFRQLYDAIEQAIKPLAPPRPVIESFEDGSTDRDMEDPQKQGIDQNEKLITGILEGLKLDESSQKQFEEYLVEEISKRNSSTSEIGTEHLRFTAYYPKEAIVEKWYTLLVYAHVQSALETVRQDALRFKEEIGFPKEEVIKTPARLPKGIEISIIPSCEGVTFNPSQFNIKWMEDYHRANFRFHVDKSFAGDAGKGFVLILVGPIVICSLKFSLLFGEAQQPTSVTTGNLEEYQGQMYHEDSIFVSYSHLDTDVVLSCRNAYRALGYSVLMDIDTLRSGQKWNDELMRMIDRADIFQLFWSKNSMKSKFVQQEWQYALKSKKGEGFIRPVYWKKPMPKPPKKLGSIHFVYVPLEPE